MRKLYAYKKRDACPVEDFLKNINKKLHTKLLVQLAYMLDESNGFLEPYVKHFSLAKYRQMYEIRVKAAETMMRIIFYEKDGEIIFLHAFYKHDRRDTGKALETAYRILESITDRNGNVSEECKKEVHLLDYEFGDTVKFYCNPNDKTTPDFEFEIFKPGSN